MKKDGRLVGEFSGDNVDGATNIIPKEMNIDVLQKGYRAVVKTLYAPKNYYARVKDISERIQSSQDHHPVERGIYSGIFSFRNSSGDYWQGTCPLLEAYILDAFPSPGAICAGNYICDLWLPFPPGHGFTSLVIRCNRLVTSHLRLGNIPACGETIIFRRPEYKPIQPSSFTQGGLE